MYIFNQNTLNFYLHTKVLSRSKIINESHLAKKKKKERKKKRKRVTPKHRAKEVL